MVAIEDAGWEIRDCLMWVYGSGFPKSLDISKAIDKAAGAEREVVGTIKKTPYSTSNTNKGWKRPSHNSDAPPEIRNKMDITFPKIKEAIQWNGWGTALKPAWEPIVLARKPLKGTVAANITKWGTGGLNIDACRIGIESTIRNQHSGPEWSGKYNGNDRLNGSTKGRFPANLIHDGSDEVLAPFPESNGQSGNIKGTEPSRTGDENTVCFDSFKRVPFDKRGDSGSASRFFYSAKADSEERNKYLRGLPQKKVNDGRDTPIDNAFQRGETLRKNTHPTVKPVDLLRYLCRLITPPKGVILDPFAGSGSTGVAAFEEGFDSILIEIDEEYYRIAKIRNAQSRLGVEA
jgi:site-specific DNA-methyltransferase (adenine-specific)